MANRFIPWALAAVLALASAATAAERQAAVKDDASLRQAISAVRPGDRLVLAGGVYRGISARLIGTAADPIVIEAADAKNPPVFSGGAVGLHISGAAHLTLRNLAVRGQSGNGVNIDDGGARSRVESHHITLDGVQVSDIGPRGNTDGIKLSGLDDVTIRYCTVHGWGGEGIDMVGCHRVSIEQCTFRGKPECSQTIGVQAKGGSSRVTIRQCLFVSPGERAINLGGSTGLPYFRPADAKCEASDITVEGCRFVGWLSPINFVGVDGAMVRHNTFVQPEKWVVRILQENRAERFVPSRKGTFERNLVIYRRSVVRVPVNNSDAVDLPSFVFADNYWFADDQPRRSKPELPTPEKAGVYGADPQVRIDDNKRPGDPANEAAKAYGAGAFRPAKE